MQHYVKQYRKKERTRKQRIKEYDGDYGSCEIEGSLLDETPKDYIEVGSLFASKGFSPSDLVGNYKTECAEIQSHLKRSQYKSARN